MPVHLPSGAARIAALALFVIATLPLSASAQQAATPQWGTYLGGTDVDRITAVTQMNGEAIAVGMTRSASLTPNAPLGSRPSTDVFVARFIASDGSISFDFPLLVFGGDGIDEPAAVASGPDGALYIVGMSTSVSFPGPTTVYRQPPSGSGANGFLARVAPTGSLQWILFLTGSADDAATGVTVVGGKVYVSGWTSSANFMGLSGAPPGTNGFVLEIDVSAVNPSLGWDLQPVLIGGAGTDVLQGIAPGQSGKLYVGGTTSSTQFPYGSKVLNTFKGGSTDAVLAQLDQASGNLDWVTFVGGSGADEGNAIAAGAVGRTVVVAGTTNSPGNLGSGAPLPDTNAFVAWVQSTGQLKFSEVRQGSANDAALAVTTDSAGNAYVGGTTASADFQGVSSSGFDSSIEAGAGFREGFVWMAPPEGGEGWASFVGGNGLDEVTSVSLRESNLLLLGLQTGSASGMPGGTNAPSYDTSLSSAQDGYLLSVGAHDLSPPIRGTVFDRPQLDTVNQDISTTTSTSALYANWSGFSDVPGIARYEWALGTRGDPTSLQPWTSVGLQTSAGATGLSLGVGQEYIVSVRAQNTYGLTTVATSNGVLVTLPDGGTGTPDAGTGGSDAGTGAPDGGTAVPDGGTDGGTPIPDGGNGGGGGSNDDDPRSPAGWGCASTGAGLPLLIGLLALLLLGSHFGRKPAPRP